MSHLFQTYSRWNINIKKAKGTIVQDEKGNAYLDFVQGIAVCNLGHCPDSVTAAVKNSLMMSGMFPICFKMSFKKRLHSFLPKQCRRSRLLLQQRGGSE